MSGWDQRSDIEDLNQDLHQRGWWQMFCFNGWSEEQRDFIVNQGYIPIFSVPDGPCLQGAEVGIETDKDTQPGPRFYCRVCAIEYLIAQFKEGT